MAAGPGLAAAAVAVAVGSTCLLDRKKGWVKLCQCLTLSVRFVRALCSSEEWMANQGSKKHPFSRNRVLLLLSHRRKPSAAVAMPASAGLPQMEAPAQGTYRNRNTAPHRRDCCKKRRIVLAVLRGLCMLCPLNNRLRRGTAKAWQHLLQLSSKLTQIGQADAYSVVHECNGCTNKYWYVLHAGTPHLDRNLPFWLKITIMIYICTYSNRRARARYHHNSPFLRSIHPGHPLETPPARNRHPNLPHRHPRAPASKAAAVSEPQRAHFR